MVSTGTGSVGSITDVPGVAVGHHQRRGRGWRTGTTVVLVTDGATPGVAVRGGGPGTRETDALRPEHVVSVVHAVCLTGGSAYGLAAADGVVQHLERAHLGFPVGPADEPERVVPVVPAAVIFDLGRGGSFTNRPTADFGARAARSARATTACRGSIGAGTGAMAGGLQGGVGSASLDVDGITVGAIAVVNASGDTVDPETGMPWAPAGLGLRRPPALQRRALVDAIEQARAGPPPLNTTIGVVATSAQLTKAECARMASVAHDGLARAVRPAHGAFDGDTIFVLATGRDELPAEPDRFRAVGTRGGQLNRLLDAAARCFATACADAVVSAHHHENGPPAYRDLCPGAFVAGRRAE